LPSPSVAVTPNPSLNAPDAAVRTYLPGDFVHVVVQAPVDTSQITATMPDDSVINLIQDRRSRVWRGIWQVPIDFKKGTYSANLSAVDVQGNMFTGQSDSFSVGELSLITLVGTSSKAATAAKKPAPQRSLVEIITSEAKPSEVPGEEALIKLIKRIVAPTATAPVPEMAAATKKSLVANNMQAGRADLRENKYSEAAAYFRVVIYLDPANKEASKLLAEANRSLAKVQEQEAKARELERASQEAQQAVEQAAQAKQLFLIRAGAVSFAVIVLVILSTGGRRR
jgi:hypothetical protein